MDEQEKQMIPDLVEGESELEQEDSKAELYYTARTLVRVLVLMVLVFTFVGRIILVDGISMEPTLWDGEVLLVRSIGYTPETGDIVVLAKDGFHDGHAIVKRVIAVGGQTVDINYAANTVSVDGTVLDEPYIKEYMIQQFYQNITTVTVPEGSVFVMGDNRNNSDDSRDSDLGVVDARLILGKAMLIVFPFNRIQSL